MGVSDRITFNRHCESFEGHERRLAFQDTISPPARNWLGLSGKGSGLSATAARFDRAVTFTRQPIAVMIAAYTIIPAAQPARMFAQ
jgi:hypothetical protein